MESTKNPDSAKEVKKVEQKAQKAVAEAAKELNIKLPLGTAPNALKLIALATLIGGLSIVGSSFIDVVNPGKTNLTLYMLRLLVGLIAIVSAYGLIEKERYSIWGYGAIVFVGAIVNPVLAIFPAIIATYLFTRRTEFKPSILDTALSKIIVEVEKILSSWLKKN
ncbi:MAG: hypothetical protein HYS87_02270 [Candidatus Colwellbacteria bacterium]|nr:hypothetical protein [Candidatus Colwellbacteria bacterium]